MYQLESLFWNIEEQKIFGWNKQTLIFPNIELKKQTKKTQTNQKKTFGKGIFGTSGYFLSY